MDTNKIVNSDELFEIVPDDVEVGDDSDMKVSAAEPITEGQKSSDAILEAEIKPVKVDEQKIEPQQQPVIDSQDAGDDFSQEFAELEFEDADKELVAQIGDSLNRQMDQELDLGSIPEVVDIDNRYSTTNGEDDFHPVGNKKPWYRAIPLWGYAAVTATLLVLCFVIWLFTSSFGRSLIIKTGSDYVSDKVTYIPTEIVGDEELNSTSSVDNQSPSPTGGMNNPEGDAEAGFESGNGLDEPIVEPVFQLKTYNLLLIGEEKMEKGLIRGRSDLIMVVSVANDGRPAKLTSVLRDVLVDIPRHSENRINASFAMGGAALLKETLKENLGIEIDNYVIVNFETFESIIDSLGGVEINLTAKEAEYLNKTNYISNSANRTVSKGVNTLNGDQALGYCRISKVWTADKQYNDLGRTSRQRYLLKQLYKSVAGTDFLTLWGIADDCLPMIVTDIDRDSMKEYMTILADMSAETEVETLTIPVEGSFSDDKVRGMIVTRIDKEANKKAFAEFIARK